jgi:hypothetical protein
MRTEFYPVGMKVQSNEGGRTIRLGEQHRRWSGHAAAGRSGISAVGSNLNRIRCTYIGNSCTTPTCAKLDLHGTFRKITNT